MAFSIAERSKDPSTQCGAVIVNDSNEILGVGFNGPPPNIDDELVPWETRPDKYAYIMHADENALWDAVDKHGRSALIGSKIYLTAMPCTECMLRMIKCGVAVAYVPSCHKPYPMSKYQVQPAAILSRQKEESTKLVIREIEYVARNDQQV